MDFSVLTNDQLVELIRAACAEAGQRGNAVAAAAQAAMLSEGERVQIARQAVEREAERLRQKEAERVAAQAAEEVKAKQEAAEQQRLWEKKLAISRRVCDIFGEIGLTVKIWSRDGEKRLYINQATGRDSLVDYYFTGNSRKKPGALEIVRAHNTTEKRPQIQSLCEDICKGWNGLQLTCDTASPELTERLAREKREADERAAEAARVEAERKAAEAKEKAEREAREKVERQERLRALLGGIPVLVKRCCKVEPQVEGQSSPYVNYDNGRRTVVAYRTDDGRLGVATLTIEGNYSSSRTIKAGRVLTEPPVPDAQALPADVLALLDDGEREAMGRFADLPEVLRDTIAANFQTDARSKWITRADSHEFRTFYDGQERSYLAHDLPAPKVEVTA